MWSALTAFASLLIGWTVMLPNLLPIFEAALSKAATTRKPFVIHPRYRSRALPRLPTPTTATLEIVSVPKMLRR